MASTELLDWLREERVTIITTVRHPADVLVSLYHYVRAATDRSNFDVDLQALATAPATPATHHVDESVATMCVTASGTICSSLLAGCAPA